AEHGLRRLADLLADLQAEPVEVLLLLRRPLPLGLRLGGRARLAGLWTGNAHASQVERGERAKPPGGPVAPGARRGAYFFLRVRLIALAASSALAIDSACLPASCSAFASAARACAFFEASSVLPAVASWICLIRSGHWLASAGATANATTASAIMRIFIPLTPFRFGPVALNPPARPKVPRARARGGRNHRCAAPAWGCFSAPRPGGPP